MMFKNNFKTSLADIGKIQSDLRAFKSLDLALSDMVHQSSSKPNFIFSDTHRVNKINLTNYSGF